MTDLGHGVRVAVDFTSPLVPLRGSGHLSLPATFELSIDKPELPCLVVLNVDASTGVPVCDAVRCYRRPGGPPVTTARLRSLPVERLMTDAIRLVALVTPTGGSLTAWGYLPAPEAVDAALRGPRRTAMTPDHLREVAEVYRSAPAAPTEAVRNHFLVRGREVDRRTAARWVAEARRGGYLGPAIRGRAGEANIREGTR